MLQRNGRPRLSQVSEIQRHPRTIEPVNRNLVDGGPVFDKVRGRVDVRTRVDAAGHGRVADSVLLEGGKRFEIWARMSRYRDGLLRERHGQVYDFAHPRTPLVARSTPSALCYIASAATRKSGVCELIPTGGKGTKRETGCLQVPAGEHGGRGHGAADRAGRRREAAGRRTEPGSDDELQVGPPLGPRGYRWDP